MSGVPRETSVQLIQQRLTCPVCLDTFKKPKLLPCQHTFCLEPCLANLVDTSKRRIKCPECRSVHIVPSIGIESYPNNITLLGFLDLDFSRSLTNGFLDRCNQCTKKHDNMIKCLDCEKFYCDNCRPSHLNQLRNETIQNVLNLRKVLPRLSQKVGNYEQKNALIVQNMGAIKQEITSVINRLVEELRTREKSLHTEADVLLDTKIRTNGLEKENAQIELTSVTSFCDAAENSLARPDQDHHNEVALINKQCKHFSSQISTLDSQSEEIKKINFSIADLKDFSNYIQKLGYLTETNTRFESSSLGQLQTRSNDHYQSMNSFNFNSASRDHTNSTNYFNYNENSAQPRQRQTWDRQPLPMDNLDIYQIFNSEGSINSSITTPRNGVTHRSDHQPQHVPIAGPRAHPPPPVSFTIAEKNRIWRMHNRPENISRNQYFEKLSSSLINWVEKLNGRVIGRFVLINQNLSKTILRSIDRENFYIELNNETAKWGRSPNVIHSVFEYGSWVEFDSTGNSGVESNPNRLNGHQVVNTFLPLTRRPEHQPNRLISPRIRTPRLSSPPSSRPAAITQNPESGESPRPVLRSNTFVIEEGSEYSNTDAMTRSVDNTEIHNVRRAKQRTKTPMTFNIMLDDENSFFETNSPRLDTPQFVTPGQPSVDYAAKTRAKLIIGKQGREHCEFVWPIDVALNTFNGQILVADSGNHRIQIFESNGKFVKAFGKLGCQNGQMNTVSGLYMDAMSNIFVVDRLNHRVQVFDRYCRFLRAIGFGEGKGAGQLNHPFSCHVNKISEIFVCDKENDRISVFHLSGKFLRAFGKLGANRGQFDKPYYVHVTRENRVLVSDCSNHRVQVFDMDGNYLKCFGKEGSAPGDLIHPRGITTDAEGFILVADSGNSRVQVFRPDDCSYVTHFGSIGNESGKFRGLEGLTVDHKSGDVIVCDKENHRVQVL